MVDDPIRRGGDEQRRACCRCRFAVKFVPAGQITGHLQCRYAPPTTVVMMVPGRTPGEIQQNMVAIAPPLAADFWCYQFVPLTEGTETPIESQNVPMAKPVVNG